MLFQRYGFLLYTTGGSNLEMFRKSKEDPQPCGEHSNPCDVKTLRHQEAVRTGSTPVPGKE